MKRVNGLAAAMALLPGVVLAQVVPDPAVFQSVHIEADSDRGYADVVLTDMFRIPELVTTVLGTGLPSATRAMVPADPTPGDPFDGRRLHDGVLLFTVPWGEGRIGARVASTTAQDVDLMVGYAGTPDFASFFSLVCGSDKPGNEDRCSAPKEHWGRTYPYAWILAHNKVPSSPGAVDEIVVETWLEQPSDALTVSGPATLDWLQDLPLRFVWDDLRLEPGGRLEGTLLVTDTNGDLRMPVALTLVRSDAPGYAPKAMVRGEPVPARLEAGGVLEGLFVDVPEGAGSLSFQSTGSGEVTLYAAHVVADSGPVVPPPPAIDQAWAVSAQPGAQDLLTFSGAAVRPGRWYVSAVNTGDTPAEFALTASYQDGFDGGPRAGAWYNPQRSGAGLFVYNFNLFWSLLWYTYLEDGTPTWYEGQVSGYPPYAFTLYRHRARDGSTEPYAVGTLLMTLDDPDSARVSWSVDGRTGSEHYQRIDGGGCGASDASGPWYPPTQSGRGLSVTVYPGLETSAAYFFDAVGFPRWAIGSTSPTGSGPLPMLQYQGVDPLAPYVPPTTVAAGTLDASYFDDPSEPTAPTGTLEADVQLAPPLSGSWSASVPIQRIGPEQGCL